MSEPELKDVQELFNRLSLVLNGKPANLQHAALSNAVAAFAMALMDSQGTEPYSVARAVYRNAKTHIAGNLAASRLSTKPPKGMH